MRVIDTQLEYGFHYRLVWNEADWWIDETLPQELPNVRPTIETRTAGDKPLEGDEALQAVARLAYVLAMGMHPVKVS